MHSNCCNLLLIYGFLFAVIFLQCILCEIATLSTHHIEYDCEFALRQYSAVNIAFINWISMQIN